MNKTININLAGLFFHIDEDAYNRLQRYLAAVRRSFQGSQGAEEIMGDIESRIAELFLEKRANDQQVIGMIQVEEVISIMGQPEDYEIDEDIFEEGQHQQHRRRASISSKQLFRDTANGFVGGVSAGMGYYLGIETIWVRAIWVFLIISSVGWFIPIYIVFWVLIPDAVTNNQRLKMMGKELNISNISGSAKADFDPVVDGQTDADHHIVGQRGKRGTVKFFGLLGRIIKGGLKILYKILGLVVFLTSTIGLIGLIVSLITMCFIDVNGHNLIHFFDIVIPAKDASWVLVLAIIFALGIPLLVLSILGLRMLVSNMRSTGTPTKIVLVVLWVLSIIALSITVANVAASQAFEANIQKVEKFPVEKDGIFELELLAMEGRDHMVYVNNNSYDFMEYEGEMALRNYEISVAVASTTDTIARMVMIQKAKGSSYEKAKEHATEVVFDYKLTDNTFTAPNYIIVPKENALSHQQTQIVIYLPVGTKFQMNQEFYNRYYRWVSNDGLDIKSTGRELYQMTANDPICLSCEEEIMPVEDGIETPSDSIVPSDTNEGKWRYEE